MRRAGNQNPPQAADSEIPVALLFLDVYALPESDPPLEVGRGILCLRIEPGGVLVALATYDHVVVVGFSLPVSICSG